MRGSPAPNDLDGWVSQLGISSCRQRAKAHLLMSGQPALPALRRGLRHRKAIVRQQCVRIFDQLVDEASLPDLVVALDDEDPGVCARALHALAAGMISPGLRSILTTSPTCSSSVTIIFRAYSSNNTERSRARCSS